MDRQHWTAPLKNLTSDRHAPAAATHPKNRSPGSWYQPLDEIETSCPACTLEWNEGSWAHERSCVLRRC
jgi:hypothetical protein